MNTNSTQDVGTFELQFNSLFATGRCFSFPCDRAGKVNMDTLTERARTNYFFARAVVGRELATPAVVSAIA